MKDQAKNIPSGWKETTLSEVADKIGMGPFGSNIKVDTFVNEGIPVISGAHLNGLRLEDKDYNFIAEDHANRLQSSNVFPGDIVFTHAGNIGQVAYIPENAQYKKYVLSQRQFYLRPDTKRLSPQYITYYFKTRDGQHKLLSNANQTGVPSISQPVTNLRSMEVVLPPLDEQRAIAAVLSSLDDKIELLRAQNKTLENIAQALFKRWFVEFEFPNSKGKPYKSSGGKMIASELGEIPEGWRVGRLGDLCSVLASGGTPSTGNIDYWNGEINWFSTTELQDAYVFESNKKISEAGLNNSSAKIFPKGSIVMAIYAAPTVGRLGILGADSTFNQAACGFTADPEVSSNEYIYLLLLYSRKEFNNLANGAAQQNLSVGLVKEYKLVAPQKMIMNRFDHIINPIFRKILNNSQQIRSLSSMRDAILPKLMKGEMRVRGGNIDKDEIQSNI